MSDVRQVHELECGVAFPRNIHFHAFQYTGPWLVPVASSLKLTLLTTLLPDDSWYTLGVPFVLRMRAHLGDDPFVSEGNADLTGLWCPSWQEKQN